MDKSIYVSGGWGYGNKGDNAIFEGMLQTFRSRFAQYRLCVTSFSPKETREQHGLTAHKSIHNLLAIRRPLSIFRWIAVAIWRATNHKVMLSPALAFHIQLIGSSEAIVMGGGGYFNDEWPDMLRALYVTVDMAKVTNTPVVIYGQTIGPFSEETINNSLKHYIKHISRIAYRDIQSHKILTRAGVPESKMTLSADEANLLSTSSENSPSVTESANGNLLIGVMAQRFRPHLGVHGPTPLGRITSKVQYMSELAKALISLAKVIPNANFLFIPSTTWDEATCREVYGELVKAGINTARFLSDPTADQFIRACQSVDLMISTNMHPVILATTAEKPSVAISYHYKLDDFMASIGLEQFTVRIDDFDIKTVVLLVQKALDNRIELAKIMRLKHIHVKKLANNNSESLASVLVT